MQIGASPIYLIFLCTNQKAQGPTYGTVVYMLHRIKHSLQTKHKNSMWLLINSEKRSAAGGSWSPGANTMNQEEIVSDVVSMGAIRRSTY